MAMTGLPFDLAAMMARGAGGQQGPSVMDRSLDFLKSPGGSSIISAILGGVGAIGQGRREERMNEQQLAMMQQQMAQSGAGQLMNDSLTRDMGLEQAAPLGWSQGYQQQQLLRNMLMQKLQGGPSIQPTNPDVLARLEQSGWKPFKPTIPEDWQNVNPFGAGQTMEALANRQGVLDKLSGGRAPALDFAQLGLNPEMAQRLNQTTGNYRQFAADDYNSNANRLMEAINLNRQGTNQAQPGGGGGIGSRLGGAASGALMGAKLGSFVPGIGNAIGAGIGGLIGLFKGGGGSKPQPQITQQMSPYSAPRNPYTPTPQPMGGGANMGAMDDEMRRRLLQSINGQGRMF